MAQLPDAVPPDAGGPDGRAPDAGITATPDIGMPDAGTPDAGTPNPATPRSSETPALATSPTARLTHRPAASHCPGNGLYLDTAASVGLDVVGDYSASLDFDFSIGYVHDVCRADGEIGGQLR